MARTTVADLAEQVAALTALVKAQAEAAAPAEEKPSRRKGKPAAKTAALLPIGSTFEYRKGKKGSRQRWLTYEVVAHDGGRMAAMLKGSDSSFVSRWTPEAMLKPYIRNVKSA